MYTIPSFKSTENKHAVDRGKNCIKRFCESSREHTMKKINFTNKKIKLLTNEQQNSSQNSKIYYICKEKFENMYAIDKKYHKVSDHCHYTGEYRGTVHSMCNLKYSVPKEIPVLFRNGSNYDYDFIIKELAEEFEKQFFCFGENIEKYITFSVPKEKEVTRIDKNAEEIQEMFLTDYNLLIAQDL